jgi:GAF domain-containing protein
MFTVILRWFREDVYVWGRVSDEAVCEMKESREERKAARRASRFGEKRMTQRAAGSRDHVIEPFARWSSCCDLLEAFVDTLGEGTQGGACDEALASMVSGLLEGTGCAVLKASLAQEETKTVAVTGTWELADLARILDEAGCDWVLALADVPMLVVRKQRGVRLRAVRRSTRVSATGVAFPVAYGGERVGALLVTYDRRRGVGSGYFAAAKLLAGAVGMQLVNQRLDERSRQQGERISRLRSDVERMGVLLRRAGDLPRPRQSSA